MWKKFVNNVMKDKKKRNGLLLVAALVILTFSTAVFFAMKNTGQLEPDQKMVQARKVPLILIKQQRIMKKRKNRILGIRL